MERLTRKDSLGYYIEDISIPYDEKRRGPDVDRLGAYEDKGVAPEDALSALEMAKAACKLVVADAYIATGLMPERVSELAQAEKAGRLVVLPCKVGDKIWYIYDGKPFQSTVHGVSISPSGDIALNFGGWPAEAVWASNIGKTVFLTCQEAEEALREETGNG